MAYIYKRGKTYSYSVEIGRNSDGKRLKETRGGFRTKKEAQQAAATVETEKTNGIYVVGNDVTVSNYIDIWYKEHKKTLKVSSAYKMAHLMSIVKEYFGNMQLQKIRRIDFQRFIDDISTRKSKRNKPYARMTQESIISFAKGIFKSAYKFELIKKDPSVYVTLPREKKTIDEEEQPPQYMEKKDLQRFLEYIEVHYPGGFLYPLIMTLTYTGCRLSEITALQWDDINSKDKTIRINKDIFFTNEKNREYVFQTPKTKSSTRTIPISDVLINTLKKHHQLQNEDKILNRKQYQNNNFVFTAKSKNIEKPLGAPVTNALVQSRVKAITRTLGIIVYTHTLYVIRTSLCLQKQAYHLKLSKNGLDILMIKLRGKFTCTLPRKQKKKLLRNSMN